MVVERELREKEKKSRHDLGREAFVERVWEWRQSTGDRILEQLKRLGASLDWERDASRWIRRTRRRCARRSCASTKRA